LIRWWDNFDNNGEWRRGYDLGRFRDGWADYRLRIDIPRYMQLLRTGLLNTDSVYTTLTGYSYFYLGIGNEIGYDSANGFSKGIPVSSKPFYGVSGQRTEQVMVPWGNPSDYSTIGNGTKFIKRGYTKASNYWWGKHWIGDLYPDSDWDHGDGTGWKFDGNLPTGNTVDTYVRIKREAVAEKLPSGTTFSNEKRCLREEGCNTFFTVGTRNSTFYHNYKNGSLGGLTTAGDEISEEYAFPLPSNAGISRPFNIKWSGSSGWKSNYDFDHPETFPHNFAEMVRVFYDHSWSNANGGGSGLVALTDSTKTHTSFQVINGLDKTIESGSAFIARWSILSLVHSFLTAGEPATSGVAPVRIEQLPRVEIKSPSIITELDNPEFISIQWSSQFCRWDGEKYTQYYPDGFNDAAWENNLRYVLLYSNDNGDSWYYMEDDPNATPELGEAGKKLTPGSSQYNTYMRPDVISNGDEFFTWAVPADLFPEGSYLMRIEVYRHNKSLHFSDHMEKIFIDR